MKTVKAKPPLARLGFARQLQRDLGELNNYLNGLRAHTTATILNLTPLATEG